MKATEITSREAYIDAVARTFHELYERLAPEHGYKTREASRKPWADVPDNNKALMRAVVGELLREGIISPPHPRTSQES